MKKTAPIPFAGSQLSDSRHVCAFFNDDDEAYRVLMPFIKDGFVCNHKAVHVVNPGQDSGHRKRLTEAGIRRDRFGKSHADRNRCRGASARRRRRRGRSRRRTCRRRPARRCDNEMKISAAGRAGRRHSLYLPLWFPPGPVVEVDRPDFPRGMLVETAAARYAPFARTRTSRPDIRNRRVRE